MGRGREGGVSGKTFLGFGPTGLGSGLTLGVFRGGEASRMTPIWGWPYTWRLTRRWEPSRGGKMIFKCQLSP